MRCPFVGFVALLIVSCLSPHAFSQQVIATIAVGNCPIPSALGDLGQERSVVRTQRFGQYLPDDCLGLGIDLGEKLRKSATEDRVREEQRLEAVRFFAGETRARLDSCYSALYPQTQEEATKK